jgi:uncharacterized membrane protein
LPLGFCGQREPDEAHLTINENKNIQLDLQINLLAEQENTEMLRLLRLLCEKSGIGLTALATTEVLAQKTKPEALVDQIEKTSKKHQPNITD